MNENSLIARDTGVLLEECIQIVREVVQSRRVTTARSTADAIQQAALDLGITSSRAKSLFYREALFVTREQWHALKLAAIRECDMRARALIERTEAARARRRQHELELGGALGCGGGVGYRGLSIGAGTELCEP